MLKLVSETNKEENKPVRYTHCFQCKKNINSQQWGTNPTDRTQYDYGYINGPMGGTWGINWERW